ELEFIALQSGVDRIELPSERTLEEARKMGMIVKKLYACCSVPDGVVKSSLDPKH
ncbi:MAG: hypothetical protein H5T49_05585, partial [Hadesarchaea archaeon]|nr:hypothetical protein [Hadesarchaea archaeon]